MGRLLITDIRQLWGIVDSAVRRLTGCDMASGFVRLDDAWLEVDSDTGKIVDFGRMAELDVARREHCTEVSAAGRIVLPAFADSHTHLVYAGSREGEFVDKINGLSYEQIAARGGGILNSADLLHQTSDEELYRTARQRLEEICVKGTAAVEIKSGYGLTVEDELRMLRVIARLRESTSMEVRATFLGAHAVGRQYVGRQQEYVQMVIERMLPAVAAEGLADYVDVFCDRGFFTPEQTADILEAAAKYGMRPKIHANELACSGGVQTGVAHDALSVDHLERIGDEEIRLLASSSTVATMLPGASFFLNMPYAPARKAVDAGVCVALASDYNPGSSPSGDMRMVWALGCIKMRLTPTEALAACTINGAAAMGVEGLVGTISKGHAATFIITRPTPSLEFIPYAYSTPWIEAVYIRGRRVSG